MFNKRNNNQRDTVRMQSKSKPQRYISRLLTFNLNDWNFFTQFAKRAGIPLGEDKEAVVEFANSKKAISQLIFVNLVDQLDVNKRLSLMVQLLNSIGLDMIKNDSSITLVKLDNFDETKEDFVKFLNRERYIPGLDIKQDSQPENSEQVEKVESV